MELTRSYCVKQRKFLPNSKEVRSKTHHICHISTLVLVSQIFLHFFSFEVFYTICLTPYTISVCLKIPLRTAVPRFCCKNTKTFLYEVFYTEGAKVTVHLINNVATQCWQWGSSTHIKENMAARHQSYSSNNFNYRTISQVRCTFTHWHLHHNTNPTPAVEH